MNEDLKLMLIGAGVQIIMFTALLAGIDWVMSRDASRRGAIAKLLQEPEEKKT